MWWLGCSNSIHKGTISLEKSSSRSVELERQQVRQPGRVNRGLGNTSRLIVDVLFCEILYFLFCLASIFSTSSALFSSQRTSLCSLCWCALLYTLYTKKVQWEIKKGEDANETSMWSGLVKFFFWDFGVAGNINFSMLVLFLSCVNTD